MAADILGTSPDLDLRKRWALLQMQGAGDASPVKHPLQAVARALQGAMGGYIANQSAEDDKAARAAMFNSLPGLPTPASPASASAPAPSTDSAAPSPVSVAQPMGNVAVNGADMNLPRGLRNNNPLNIEAGRFTQSQPGFAGSDGRFAKFASADDGIGAASKLLDTYSNKYGLNTVQGIVGRWAPAGDGNNVSAYAASVAKDLGVDPAQPLDMSNPTVKQALIMSMGKVENGRPIQVAQANTPAQSPAAMAPPATNRASVQIPPDVAATIKRLGADPRTSAAAMQLYMQYAKPTEQWVQERNNNGSIYQRNLTTGKMEAIEKSDVLPEEAVAQKERLAKAGKPETVINNTINPVLKGIGDRFNAAQDAADSAQTQVKSIHEARRALDGGAFTGIAGDASLFGAKVGSLFGIPSDKAANTETLRASLGTSVLEKAKTLGANPSNADRDYIEKVVGGQIKLEEASIRRLLDMQERWAREAVGRANRMGERMLKAQPELKTVAPFLQYDEPISYDDYVKATPASPTLSRPSAPQAPAQSAPAEGAIAVNPKTNEKIILKGGQWVPVQ
jgi:hypothetical protein